MSAVACHPDQQVRKILAGTSKKLKTRIRDVFMKFSDYRELSGYKRMLLCERKFAKSEKPVSRIVSVM